tara:strand:- start:288 stop:2879 length:2592 start_codon:yes stop_codon:yes gene_type:complete
MTNLSDLLPAGGSAKEATAIASGNIATGQTIVLKSNGQIEAVGESQVSEGFGSIVTYDSGGNYPYQVAIAYDTNVDRICVCYYINGSYPLAQVGTVSGSSITFGTATQVMTQTSGGMDCCFDASQNKIIVVSYDNSTTKGVSAVGTITSGTNNISFGSTSQIYNQQTNYIRCAYDEVNQGVVAVFRDANSYGRGYFGTTSGTTTSWGGTTTYSTGNPVYNEIAYSPDDQCFCVIAREISNNRFAAYHCSVSGGNLQFGSVNVITQGSGNYNYLQVCYNSTEQKFVAVCYDSASYGYGDAYVGTVSSTSINWSGNNRFANYQVSWNGLGFDPSANKLLFTWRDDTDGYSYYSVGTQSGNVINFSTRTRLAPTANYRYNAIEYDPDTEQLIYAYQNHANGNGEARMFQNAKTVSNVANFIGITSEPITSGNSGKYNPQGGVATTTEPSAGETGTAVNFGVGDTADMKAVFDSGSNRVVFGYQSSSTGYAASSVAEINASNNSVSFGSVGIVQVASSSYNSITYDASADKIVQITTNPASGYYNGVANVGTVNPAGPNTISFSGLVSYTGTTTIGVQDITYDSTNQKTVICWNRSNFGESIVGTISAGAISFPTYPTGVTQWETSQNSISAINNTFDSNAGSIVVAYQLSGIGLAIVAGQISAGSVTWGSRFAGASQGANTSMAEGGSICFDSHNNRVVIPYEDTGTNEGKAVVCTVSGTTVTAGSPVTFSTDAMQGQSIQSTFDSTLNKVIIAYIHDADSYVRIISGTVSGTSITFDTPIVVTSVGVTSSSVSIAYDSNANRSLVGYKGSTTFGAVYVTTGTQSPLTIDSTYYIQNNGNITKTATGNTEIGKAVTTTQLLLKGAP